MHRIALRRSPGDYCFGMRPPLLNPLFAPARALYGRAGFVETLPFGDYRPDPNSVFLTLAIPA